MPRIIRNSKISNLVLENIILDFLDNTSASTASKNLKINRHTTERVYAKIRKVIEFESGLTIPDEISVFDISLKSSGGIPIIGVLAHRGKVITKIIGNLSRRQYKKILKTMVLPKIIGKRAYPTFNAVFLGNLGLTDASNTRGKRIKIIDNFFENYLKNLKQHRGINWKHYHHYLKEAEWLFNNRHANKENKKTIIMNYLKYYRY